MNKKNEQISITKMAFKKSSKNFQNMAFSLSIFSLIVIISLIFGFITPITLFLTVPFLIIPSLFALSGMSAVSEQTVSHEGVGFFVMFRTYFSQLFRGGYKVILGFLKALAVYFITSSVISTIFVYGFIAKEPAYIELIESIGQMGNIEEAMDSLFSYINNNESFKLVVFYTNFFSSIGAFAMFAHHISVNGVKYYHNFLTVTPIPIGDLNIINKVTFKKIRKPFYKDYYKSLWFMLVILIVAMAGGQLIGHYLLPNIDDVQSVMIGYFLSFISLLFFLPYYFNVLQFLYKKYNTDYIDTFISLSLESIDEIKKTNKIDPEKEKAIREFLDAQKKQNDENKSNNDK